MPMSSSDADEDGATADLVAEVAADDAADRPGGEADAHVAKASSVPATGSADGKNAVPK